MTRMGKHKGFTLIELIVVIVIVGILASVTVPRLFGFTERAKISVDQSTVGLLNTLTPIYRISNESSDPFEDETKSNTELINILVEDGYLSSFVEPQSKDATFAWMLDDERWYLLFPDSFYVISSEDGLSVSNGLLGAWNGSQTYSGSSKDIVIPNSLDGVVLKMIGQNAFKDKGLVAVSFQEGSQVVQIHAHAFQDNNIASVTIPDSVERIDLWSFKDNNLTEIKLPSSLQKIEQKAFAGNDLNKITIGSEVSDIGTEALGEHTDEFKQVYSSQGAGTYIWNGESWIKQGN
ncbi:leucine-rich repeat domain-containing protein [Clostridia bacterium]|nr:leucine-rich repeat domain-containing protein [Clostridia bacterium]